MSSNTAPSALFEAVKNQFPDCCIEGIGKRDKNGYVRLPIGKDGGGKTHRFGLHRVIYRAYCGPVPTGLVVMHSCDNPACINPKHLSVGTHRENMRDMVRKERTQFGSSHYKAKLSEDQVREIRASSDAYPVLAARFGISRSTVANIRARRIWKHLGGQ